MKTSEVDKEEMGAQQQIMQRSDISCFPKSFSSLPQ
jgi:hypothetical protein